MKVIKIDITVPQYGGSERKLIYLNDKAVGYISLTDSLRMETRIKAMIKKYVENYEKICRNKLKQKLMEVT